MPKEKGPSAMLSPFLLAVVTELEFIAQLNTDPALTAR